MLQPARSTIPWPLSVGGEGEDPECGLEREVGWKSLCCWQRGALAASSCWQHTELAAQIRLELPLLYQVTSDQNRGPIHFPTDTAI